MLKKILRGLLIFIVAVTGIGFLLPGTYRLERKTDINAPAAIVFGNVNDLKNMNKWSPWLEYDPNTQLTYAPTTVGVGAWYSWKSEVLNEGKMTIADSKPNESVHFNLDFGGSIAKADIKTVATDSLHTTASWSMDMDFGLNPFSRWAGLMMDKFMALDFEKGLANLKKLSETPK